MANEFFNASGTPAQGSQIVSPNVRAEFSSIAAAFDKMPALAANPYKVIYVNASGSALDTVGGNGLLKMSTSGVPTVATAGVDYQAWSANLDEYAAVNPTAAGLALLDDVDAAAQRATLGLVIGTNVQAYDADLTTWAGVTPGTGVVAALAVAVGSAGAPVVNGGVLGTPSSGTLTSCTGLPAAGVTGTALTAAAAVTVAQGGTGRATSTTAYGLLAAGTTATGAHQTLAAGATTELLVGGGAAALPVWTAATGSGAPVRATSPTLVTPVLGTPSSGTLTNCDGTATNLVAGATNALKSATTTVNVSSATAPSSGQVLTATGSTTATWQTPSVATSSLPRSYLAGFGLSNNGTDATNDIDIAVGTCRDSTNTYDITLAAALTKRLDAAWAVGTNQGGLDTGAIANGTYHIWVIRRSDTQVVDVLFSASASAPTMPANYDAKRRIGSILREVGAIVAFKQNGDSFRRSVPISDLDATGMPGTATSRTLSVPTGIQVLAEMNVHLDNETTAGRIVLLMTSLDEADTAPSYTVFTLIAGDNAAGRKPVCAYEAIKTNASAQIRTRFDLATSGTDRLKITTLGWIDTRGRDD